MEVAEAACYLGGAISALMAKRMFRMHEKTFINKIFSCYFTVIELLSGWKFNLYENHDLAIARSSSSRADPGLRVAFKCLNV